MIVRTCDVASPIGNVWLCVSEDGLAALGIGPRARQRLEVNLRRFAGARFVAARDPDGVASRIDAYFAGGRPLDGLRLDLGGTPFQARVWRALALVPLGRTETYAQVAARIGRPTAIRAVARANATNPVSLVVPCHRIIGTAGDLRGYGWGLARKRWLLEHEAAWRGRAAVAPRG